MEEIKLQVKEPISKKSEFHQWAISMGLDTSSVGGFGYTSKRTNWCWMAWKGRESEIKKLMSELEMYQSIATKTFDALDYELGKRRKCQDYSECSGNPLSCPENEGHGCGYKITNGKQS